MQLSSTNLPGVVSCPTSKSYAARVLILGALKKEPFTITDLPRAQDTLDMVHALKQVGLEITHKDEKTMTINNSYPSCEKDKEEVIKVDIGEGGTTARFLIPFLCLGKKKYELYFSGRLNERPMEELYKTLQDLGVFVKKEVFGVSIQGPLTSSGKVTLDCQKSSQFASGFELIGSVVNLNIEYKNLHLSKRYFDLTQYLIEEIENINEYRIPADFSSLGYFLAYGALRQNINVKNVFSEDKFQADSKIISLLEEIGVQIEFSKEGLVLNPPKEFRTGIKVDANECIDLVPTLMFLASYLPFESHFSNLKGLKDKESDRLTQMLEILSNFNVNYVYDDLKDLLIITGLNTLKKLSTIKVAHDHRMVMVASLFLKYNGGGEVEPAHAVEKSFPTFFDSFS